MDAIDLLFSGKDTKWSVAQARDIIGGVERKATEKGILYAYENVMGKPITIDDLAKNPELAQEFQAMLTQKIELITLLARSNLILQ